MAYTVILGNGGHARAIDPKGVFRHLDALDDVPDDVYVIIGVGDIDTRRKLYKRFMPRVVEWPYMSDAIVHETASIGVNVLFNTGAQVDHDCEIGDHCVISPGAILCGGVKLGEACFIGAGAIIVENVELAPETFVPAGTLVCGPDDFRKPQRVVRPIRTDET